MNLVEQSQKSPAVRNAALSILRSFGLDSRNTLAVARALFRWIRNNIKFVLDPAEVETIQDPLVTLNLLAGDCDDHSILMAALAESVGIPARFHVVGPGRQEFQHVYAELLVNGRWLPADTAESKQLGHSVGHFNAEKIYAHEGASNMRGLGQTVTIDILRQAAYDATIAELDRQWSNKTINRASIMQAMNDAVAPGSPLTDDYARGPVLQAMRDFLAAIPGDQYIPTTSLAGLGFIGGLIGDIWGAVKGAWNGIKNIITGGGSEVPAAPPPESPWKSFLSGPVPWLLGGAAVLFALRSGKK